MRRQKTALAQDQQTAQRAELLAMPLPNPTPPLNSQDLGRWEASVYRAQGGWGSKIIKDNRYEAAEKKRRPRTEHQGSGFRETKQ